MAKNNNKRAIITGILGQDGSFMAELLASKGYSVYGLVKDQFDERHKWICSLSENISIIRTDILDKKSLTKTICDIKPNEIYNFAGISNVFSPWENTNLIFAVNAKVPENILKIILDFDKSIKFFQASSCLIFGRDTSGLQDELTPSKPIYPYGISKLYADNMVSEYRKEFGLFCCSGIFFNHESERRADNFFSKKIVRAAYMIKMGIMDSVKVGNLDSLRDYGYAKDCVNAAWRMLNSDYSCDYVIGTGKLISMRDFTKKCFEYVGLNYADYIQQDPKFIRKEMPVLCANYACIKNDLGWEPTTSIDQMIDIMMKDIKLKLTL